MKYRVHGVGRTKVPVTISHDGADTTVNFDAIEIEMVPAAPYAKSFTHVILSKGDEDAAAIVARFPVDAEFEINPVAA